MLLFSKTIYMFVIHYMYVVKYTPLLQGENIIKDLTLYIIVCQIAAMLPRLCAGH